MGLSVQTRPVPEAGPHLATLEHLLRPPGFSCVAALEQGVAQANVRRTDEAFSQADLIQASSITVDDS